MNCYFLKEEKDMKYDAYVQLMTNVKEDRPRRSAYVNESYILKNYQHYDDSLVESNEE